METNEQHLFAERVYHLSQASSLKRFANYIIDLLSFYAVATTVGVIIALVNPSFIEALENENPGLNIVERLISLLLYGLYMFAIEAIFKGKSLGKLITGTRAVNEDGTNVSLKAAFLRGLSRAVPFNALSALGNPPYPWHDRWTKTYVIDEVASNRPVDA